MASLGDVNVNVHHIQHTAGSVEAWETEHQIVNRDRLGEMLACIRTACMEYGFDMHSVEVIESFLPKHGHMPELHLVLVQLPPELAEQMGMLSEQLKEVRDKRGRRGEEWRVRQQSMPAEQREVDYYQEPRHGL